MFKQYENANNANFGSFEKPLSNLRSIHTEWKWTRKQKNFLIFAVYSLIFFVCYHPQRSCEGYVFTNVCLSTGGSTWPGTPPGPGTPPEIRPLLRTVRILLECILVLWYFSLLRWLWVGVNRPLPILKSSCWKVTSPRLGVATCVFKRPDIGDER